MYKLYHNHGWIEVICGSMFSGKTEELLRRLKRVEIAGRKFQIFKPEIDDRYGKKEYIISHDKAQRKAITVSKSKDIFNLLNDNIEVIAIDEAQFFDMDIVDVAEKLAKSGLRVIIAGLDQDYRGIPFGPMPHLMAVAENVEKLHAICKKCGNIASKSKKLGGTRDIVEIGHTDIYEARCRHCFGED